MLRLLVLGALLTLVGAHDIDEPTYANLLREQGFSDDDIEIFLQVILYLIKQLIFKTTMSGIL